MTKSRKFDACVFVGRFQPFHNGHLHVMRRALAVAERLVVCVGGADGARRPRNPWSFAERAGMIRGALAEKDGCADGRLVIVGISDYLYNDAAWIAKVQAEVAYHAHGAENVALIGRRKDESGYYLGLFPQWEGVPVVGSPDIEATDIRARLFLRGELPGPELVPASTLGFLTEYMATPEARWMQREFSHVAAYRAEHDTAKYHRNNVCADAVVLQGGHVLLVRRRASPGAGRLALPGGHINRNETALDACIRELREETGIKVPEPVLRGSIEGARVFDDPWRSDLARTYSHAFLIRLANERGGLAKVRGGSDAESAMWVPLNEVRKDEMFDDHWHIIQSMTGVG